MLKKFLMVALLLATSHAYALTPARTFGCPGYDTSISQECSFHLGNSTEYVDVYRRASLESLSTAVDVFASYQLGLGQPLTAVLSYSFEVSSKTGPFSGFIPLLITASGYTVASGLNKAEASITTTLNMANPSALRICAGRGCNQTAQTSFNGTFLAYAAGGQEQNITLSSAVEINGTIGAIKAYVDPYIQIDPEYSALHPEYYLNFSSGITNTPPVPEPETYAMMLAGLGFGVVALRRKHKARRH